MSAPPIPEPPRSLDTLHDRAQACRACALGAHATQAVLGEGPPDARTVLIGEQPGDVEDVQGRPFVGPAGKLLDRALIEAGLDRQQLYLTNAVKHFKWRPQGQRRLHQKPTLGEVRACHPWLEAELALIRPRLVVCLGATAAQSVFGRAFKITTERGLLHTLPSGATAFATVHPSYLLRIPDRSQQQAEYARFVTDLKRIHAFA